MKRKYINYVVLLLAIQVSFSCIHSRNFEEDSTGDRKSEIVIKKRGDGTISSVNQVDDMGYVDGIRVTYYPDGKTVYSKLSFKKGIHNGPSIKYYDNGQIFEHTNYEDGKKHGPARKYYKNGRILADYEYENDKVLPGLKEYDKSGSLITTYPEIEFRELDFLETKNRIDLEMFCAEKNRGIKFFLVEQDNGKESRIYLISENSSASIQYYLKPGDILDKKIEIIAEIPTELGNTMVKKLTYHLNATHQTGAQQTE